MPYGFVPFDYDNSQPYSNNAGIDSPFLFLVNRNLSKNIFETTKTHSNIIYNSLLTWYQKSTKVIVENEL